MSWVLSWIYMPAKKKSHRRSSFAQFVDDPMIELLVLVIALVALIFSLLELGQIIK